MDSFDVVVRLQTMPDVQKLKHSMSCPEEKALLAVSGYDIAPQNYNIIRKVFIEKFGEASSIKKKNPYIPDYDRLDGMIGIGKQQWKQ